MPEIKAARQSESSTVRADQRSREVLVYADFSLRFKDLLSSALCRNIAEQYEQNPAKRTGQVRDAHGELTVGDINISSELPIPPEGV